MAEIQAQLQSQDEQIRILRQQAPSESAAPIVPPAVVPVLQVGEIGNRWEPPIFEGGPDPLKAEQWLTMITVILDFMRIEGHDRVACATYMLREDAHIWLEVAS